MTAVLTSLGRIACEVVVNCAGQWAREVGRMAGVNVPLVSVQHQYLITDAIPGITRDLPTLRDPDRLTYYKEDVGGLVMGGYEPNPIPWAVDGFPENFNFRLAAAGLGTLPADHGTGDVARSGIGRGRHQGTGQWAGEFHARRQLHPRPGAGSAGFLRRRRFQRLRHRLRRRRRQGAGRMDRRRRSPVRCVAGGHPPLRAAARRPDWVRKRTLEIYGKHYTIAWPAEEHESGRPLRRSPLYDRLKRQGAVFGEKLGWERPNWFAARGRSRATSTAWAAELVRSRRARAPGSARARRRSSTRPRSRNSCWSGGTRRGADWICANDVAKPVGSLVYTQMLNARGGIECDLTVARLAEDRFLHRHRNRLRDPRLRLDLAADLPGARCRACRRDLALRRAGADGPAGAATCSRTSRTDDVGNAAFPFGSASAAVAGAPVRALRVTYVGELGWELHVPAEFAATSTTR